jgi:hypothetical protein
MVRTGFYDKQRLMDVFCEEMYAPGELESSAVSSALDAEFGRLAAAKTTWPAVTDCDRLNGAFDAISKRGIIAIQNAGYTQSDGYHDVRMAYDRSSHKGGIRGYCYYHGQDLEHAVRGEGLLLSFGPIDPEDEETKGPEIGRIIREELEARGFEVAWNGTFSQRIHVPKLNWQRR